jgi:hypothetical protein
VEHRGTYVHMYVKQVIKEDEPPPVPSELLNVHNNTYEPIKYNKS